MRILIVTLGLCCATSIGASEYHTRPPVAAAEGYSLSITAHPGLCAEDAPKCVSTRAAVYRWPVVDGDRVVVTEESAPTATTAVVRTRHLFVPVDVGATPSTASFAIEVVLAPKPRLIINRGTSRFTVDVIPGRWVEVPSPDGADAVFARIDQPLSETP